MLFKLSSVVSDAGSPRQQGPSSTNNETSLTTILSTPSLRIELALLLLLCTDAMRTDIASTFDVSKPENSASRAPKPSPKPKEEDLISFDTTDSMGYEKAVSTPEAEEIARRELEEEMSASEMQGLRRAALTYFDKWRAGIMHRVCDVLGVRGDVVRSAKAKRATALATAEKRKQEDLLGWDEGMGAEAEVGGGVGLRYEAIKTKLAEFEMEKRVCILHCVLLVVLSREQYPAHSRILMLRLAATLRLPVEVLAEHEKSVAQGLLASASAMDGDEAAKKKAAENSESRKWKVGLAAVGGAVLIGVTGGLAAPLLAAGVGTVMGGLGLGATVISGYLGALAGSSVIVGSLFGAYGAKMTSSLVDKYAREVEDFKFIPVKAPAVESGDAPGSELQHRLRVAIGVSGWLNSASDVHEPWDVIEDSGIEPFALRYELKTLLNLGDSLSHVAMSYAWEGAKIAIVRRTLLGALYAGLWPIGLVKVANVLDNPFSIAIARSHKAGKVLAQALINKAQGERPVTLIGYSLGARVIYSCLLELAKQNAFGLVESVVLMGAPTPSDSRFWRKIRAVVSARVVNVYSTEDYILGFLYRTSKLQFGVAGLQEVNGVIGVENVNMSGVVTGHDKYRYLVGSILKQIGLEDVDERKVEEQKEIFEVMEAKKERVKKDDQKKHYSQVIFDAEEVDVHKTIKDTGDSLRPSTTRGPSSSGDIAADFKMRVGPEPKSLVSTQPSLSPVGSSNEGHHRIVLQDMDGNPPVLPLHKSFAGGQEALTVKPTEPHKPTPTVGVLSVDPDIDSETESVASIPLGELSMVEPLPEPDLDVQS